MNSVGNDTPRFARLPRRLAGELRTLWNLFSRFLAFLVLVLYLPVLTVACLATLLTSAGPIFVRRVYCDQADRLFYLYEFRTECWRTWQETRVGSLLRRMDLVRLPRLFNVLMGEIAAGAQVQRVGS